MLQDNPILKKLYLNFFSATNKSGNTLNICTHTLSRNRYNSTEIKLFLLFTLILMIVLNYPPCKLGLNPSPKKWILRIFSKTKQTNCCCNETYLSNNLNAIFIHLSTNCPQFFIKM